jgi:hypothetical protein
MLTKILGGISAVLGAGAILASKGKLHDSLPIIKSMSTNNILIIGGALVLLGIGLLLAGKMGIRQANEEVPIYEGEGKKRKIVGYKREK